jgi:hypothetical protein
VEERIGWLQMKIGEGEEKIRQSVETLENRLK